MKLTEEQYDNFYQVARTYGDVRTDYSGRFMYGKNCIGIVGEGNQLEAVAKLFIGLAETELANIIDEFSNCICSDNMGLGWIIYFPDIEFDEK